MRPLYGCPENYRESLSTPTATFLEILNGLLLRSIIWMCKQNLKFVALPVPEIIGGTQKIWAVRGYPMLHFLPSFLMGSCSDGPCKCTGQIWSPIALPVPETIAIEVLCGVANPPILRARLHFPTAPLVCPKLPHVSLRLSGWPLGNEERRYWANCPCN